jgi:hypothetical protein
MRQIRHRTGGNNRLNRRQQLNGGCELFNVVSGDNGQAATTYQRCHVKPTVMSRGEILGDVTSRTNPDMPRVPLRTFRELRDVPAHRHSAPGIC